MTQTTLPRAISLREPKTGHLQSVDRPAPKTMGPRRPIRQAASALDDVTINLLEPGPSTLDARTFRLGGADGDSAA